jgi:hypothetical protein
MLIGSRQFGRQFGSLVGRQFGTKLPDKVRPYGRQFGT